MSSKIASEVLATIAYADVFDFPLTSSEVKTWLIAKTAKQMAINQCLSQLTGKTNIPESFCYLAGKQKLVNIRNHRKIYAVEKMRIISGVAFWYKFIPTLKLVGITGGLSQDNADLADDIDLFFIVNSGTIWITRILVICLTQIFSRRRKVGDTDVKNKICLNMFITDDALSMPISDRDIYLAHEVLMLKPIWKREGIYLQFLQSNSWVKQYLPNAWNLKYESRIVNSEARSNLFSFIIRYSVFIIRVFEPLARFIQLKIMEKHRTTEIISDTVLRFHPLDARDWIKHEFERRLKFLNIPLDKEIVWRIK